MNIRDYKQMLALHDWFYSSSDDYRWYEKGLAYEQKLKQLAKGKKTYEKAYSTQFHKHFRNGKNTQRPMVKSST